MLVVGLCTSSQGKDTYRALPLGPWDHLDHSWDLGGKSAGLVKTETIRFAYMLKVKPPFDEGVVPGRIGKGG